MMRQILLYIFLLLVCSVSAEQFRITGKVVDARDKEPLIGAGVYDVCTHRYIYADIDGNFSIEVEKGAILKFSFCGYYEKEVEVLNDSSLVIELEEDPVALKYFPLGYCPQPWRPTIWNGYYSKEVKVLNDSSLDIVLRDNGTSTEIRLYRITGKVVDEVNEPLIGTTVWIKGTDHHTATDMDGNFSIEVEKGAILKFSFCGYYEKEVEVLNDSSLVIEMEEYESDTSDDFNYMMGQGPSLCPCPQHTAIRERIKQNQNNLKRNLQEAVINHLSSTLTKVETVEYIGNSSDKYIKVDGEPCFSTNVSYYVVSPNGAKEKHSAHVVTNVGRDKIIEWKDI